MKFKGKIKFSINIEAASKQFLAKNQEQSLSLLKAVKLLGMF